MFSSEVSSQNDASPAAAIPAVDIEPAGRRQRSPNELDRLIDLTRRGSGFNRERHIQPRQPESIDRLQSFRPGPRFVPLLFFAQIEHVRNIRLDEALNIP